VSRFRRASHRWLPSLTGGAVLAAFVATALFLYTVVEREQTMRRAQAAAFAAELAREALASLEDVGRDLAVLISDRQPLDADAFAETVATVVEGSPAAPAIRGIALVAETRYPLPPPFTAERTDDGALKVWPQAEAGPAFPAVFAWPPAVASRVVGYDLWTDAARRRAAAGALGTGEPRASEFVVLTQDRDPQTGEGPYSTLLITPFASPLALTVGDATFEAPRALVAIGVSIEAFFCEAATGGPDPGPRSVLGPTRGPNGERLRDIVFADVADGANVEVIDRFVVPFGGLELEMAVTATGSLADALPMLSAAPVALAGVVAGGGMAALTGRLQRARRSDARNAARSRALYELATEAAALGLWTVEAGDAEVVLDARMAELVDAPAGSLDGFLSMVHPDDRAGLRRAMTCRRAEAEAFRVEFRLQRRDGAWRWLETFGRAQIDPIDGRSRVLGLTSDITARRMAQEELRRMALEDPLTGLANRHRFQEYLDRVEPDAGPCALALIDLDAFKEVNDTRGHPAGDALLQAVAGRLRALIVEPADVVARIGGDEFALLLRGCGDRGTALQRAEAAIAAISAPLALEFGELHPTACAGVAIAPTDAATGEALLQCADVALYRAKANGPNVARGYTASFGAELAARKELEARLRRDVLEERLELHLQPVVDLRTWTTVGAEALLRWPAGEEGWVPPSTFVPVAESCGLMPALERFVLAEACALAARWPARQGGDAPRLAVNVSAALWRDGESFLAAVEQALAISGLPPSRLTLEVSETSIASHEDDTRGLDVLNRLRAQGVRIAIDDFGTGYANLIRLRRLGVDEIKIDRTFVTGIGDEADAAAVVQAVIGLGHALALDVVAEGVETAEQARFLANLGCDVAQGYFFAGPMRPADFQLALAREVAAAG